MKRFWLVAIPVFLILALALGACSSSGTTTSSSTSTPSTTSTPTTTSSTTTQTTTSSTSTTSTTPGAPTAGELASSGQGVYASHCAGCHGKNGQGVTAPAVIGSNQALAKYNTAQGLLKFITEVMPASNPGSLSSQQYLEVTAYLLVQNNFVTDGQAMDSASLSGITLK